MGDDDHVEVIAGALTEGVRALRDGRPADAVPLLTRVCDDPALRDADDLGDIRARALSLCAEALLLSGRPGEAFRRATAALAATRRLGDTEGVHEVERLQVRIAAAAPVDDAAITLGPAERAALADAPLDAAEALYGVSTRAADMRADWLLRRGTVAAEDGDVALAAAAAARALAQGASAPRIAVLGRLLLARAQPERAPSLLREAIDAARNAEAHTLVAAVARAAGLAGVALDDPPS